MAALFLSCSETASPGSREIFLATDPGEAVESAPTVELRQVAEAASAALLADVIDGEELVYSRVTAASSSDDPNAVTVETGGLDDAIHQRAARPWTHLDATEPSTITTLQNVMGISSGN